MEEKYYIGVDLGGTKIATILCDENCNIRSSVKIDTNAVDGQHSVLQRIKGSIDQTLQESNIGLKNISAIGVSSPGPLSVSQGIVLYVATLGWQNVPIRKILEDEFGVPVFIENDCNAAAFSELLLGVGRGYRDLVYITVSTGIGSGIIVDGRIAHGKHDAAGEFGHICIEPGGRLCSCGNRGCLQSYSSGTSIAQIARENLDVFTNSSNLAFGEGTTITSELVAKAAFDGDEMAKNIWRNAGEKLGHGISILYQLLDPEIVVIGGGASKAWDLFYEPMIESIGLHVYKLIKEDIRIAAAQLGDNACALGAVLIAIDKLKLS